MYQISMIREVYVYFCIEGLFKDGLFDIDIQVVPLICIFRNFPRRTIIKDAILLAKQVYFLTITSLKSPFCNLSFKI